MISIFNPDMEDPCSTNMSRSNSKMCNCYEIKVEEKLKDIPGTVSVTTAAWLSRIDFEYLPTTVHLIIINLIVRSIFLAFARFSAPNNAEAKSIMPADVL